MKASPFVCSIVVSVGTRVAAARRPSGETRVRGSVARGCEGFLGVSRCENAFYAGDCHCLAIALARTQTPHGALASSSP